MKAKTFISSRLLIISVVLISIFILYLNNGASKLDLLIDAYSQVGRIVDAIDGDVPSLNMPKAAKFIDNQWITDPHYKDEVMWYPYMGPLLVSFVTKTLEIPIFEAMFYVPVVHSALTLTILLAFFYWIMGISGYVSVLIYLVFIMAEKRLAYPFMGIYPHATSLTVFYLNLFFLGWFLSTIGKLSRKKQGRLALFFCGLCHGLLSVWHGASFIIIAYITAMILIWSLKKLNQIPDLLDYLWYAIGFAPLFLSLIGLQIFHYGEFNSPGGQWVSPDYVSGNTWDTLQFKYFPKNPVTISVLAFCLGVIFLYKSKSYFSKKIIRNISAEHPVLLPTLSVLILAYFLSQLLSNLGFSLNDQGIVSYFANILTFVPPHTMKGRASNIFELIYILAIGLVLSFVLEKIKIFIKNKIIVELIVLFSSLLLIISIVHNSPEFPAGDNALINRGKELLEFEQDVFDKIGYATLASKTGFSFRYVPGNILFTPQDLHTNPYVQNDRRIAHNKLQSNDFNQINDTLLRYDIQYYLTNTEKPQYIELICKSKIISNYFNGKIRLVKLSRPCNN
jgi:hypothetical protein